jgi:hypothetical protein
MIRPKIFELTRNIFRNLNLVDKKSIKAIIQEFISTKFDLSKIKSISKNISLIEKYSDLAYELDAYKNQIKSEVKDSRDLESIIRRLKDLELLVEKFNKSKKNLELLDNKK